MGAIPLALTAQNRIPWGQSGSLMQRRSDTFYFVGGDVTADRAWMSRTKCDLDHFLVQGLDNVRVCTAAKSKVVVPDYPAAHVCTA
jgi:hypothetical protein